MRGRRMLASACLLCRVCQRSCASAQASLGPCVLLPCLRAHAVVHQLATNEAVVYLLGHHLNRLCKFRCGVGPAFGAWSAISQLSFAVRCFVLLCAVVRWPHLLWCGGCRAARCGASLLDKVLKEV
jgi:hypothetical protein